MEVLSHKAFSVLPEQLGCILTLLEASHPPPQQPTCWTPSHPTPGKGAPGGAKQRLQGSCSKEEARERLGKRPGRPWSLGGADGPRPCLRRW